jgi:Na+/melibiose symporter-like transporter
MVGGPAAAGTIALLAAPSAAVATELVLKLAALALCLGLRLQGSDEGREGTLRSALLEGFRHVWRAAPLLAVTTAGVIGMAGRGLLTVAFPLFAVETLGASEGAAGYMWGALACGSAAGALALARVPARLGHERVVLGSLGLGGGLMLLWGLAGSLAGALGLVLAAGIVLGPGLSATFGVRQRFAPAALHGHIFMTGAGLKVAGFGLGAALAGPAVIGLGPSGALLLAAGLHVAAAGTGAALLLRSPRRA